MAKSFRSADGLHVDKPSGRAICVGTQAVSGAHASLCPYREADVLLSSKVHEQTMP